LISPWAEDCSFLARNNSSAMLSATSTARPSMSDVGAVSVATRIFWSTYAASSATYRRLGQLAGDIVRSGYPAVVDAAFLKRTEREAFRTLAAKLGVRFVILDFRAPVTLLRQRVAQRRARADDASEADLAVLERQIVNCEPLTPAEMEWSIVADGTRPPVQKTWRHVRRVLCGKTSAKQGRSFA